jgi:hypothetical protein
MSKEDKISGCQMYSVLNFIFTKPFLDRIKPSFPENIYINHDNKITDREDTADDWKEITSNKKRLCDNPEPSGVPYALG